MDEQKKTDQHTEKPLNLFFFFFFFAATFQAQGSSLDFKSLEDKQVKDIFPGATWGADLSVYNSVRAAPILSSTGMCMSVIYHSLSFVSHPAVQEKDLQTRVR